MPLMDTSYNTKCHKGSQRSVAMRPGDQETTLSFAPGDQDIAILVIHTSSSDQKKLRQHRCNRFFLIVGELA